MNSGELFNWCVAAAPAGVIPGLETILMPGANYSIKDLGQTFPVSYVSLSIMLCGSPSRFHRDAFQIVVGTALVAGNSNQWILPGKCVPGYGLKGYLQQHSL